MLRILGSKEHLEMFVTLIDEQNIVFFMHTLSCVSLSLLMKKCLETTMRLLLMKKHHLS